MNRARIADYILLYATFAVYSVVSVCSKLAAMQADTRMTVVFMGAEIVVLGIYALMWQQVLKRFPMIVAMSNKGITVIYGLLWSVFLFREHITVNNIIGTALILLGIGLVSSDG